MMDRLLIIGASGHGKVIADIARLNGYNSIAFLDDDPELTECEGYPVIGKCKDAPEGDIFVAIGNAVTRRAFVELYSDREQPVLIHPDAVIADRVSIGKGTAVMAGVVINPGTTIGEGCIINTCSSVDHDCNIGDYAHISVGSHISGTVDIGCNTWIGAGSTVINNIEICNDVLLGAGSVVVKDIDKPGKYYGVPARQH